MNTKCVRIEVNCAKNHHCTDPMIEPEYFGFDFFVKEDAVDKYLFFINGTMVHYGLPVLSIKPLEHTLVANKDVFDYQRIVETINSSKNDLLEALENNESPKRS